MAAASGNHARLGHRGRRRTPVRTYLTGALGILLLFALLPSGSFADGSRTAYPADATCGAGSSCRAAIEWSTSTYGPAGSTILRRTLFTVFLKAGETLETGSSAVGVAGTDAAGNATQGDIWVWSPGAIGNDQATSLPGIGNNNSGVAFKCSSQTGRGRITSRALETAGPQSADGSQNTTGYVPCTFVAPTDGLYKVGFFGPAGPSSASTKAPTGDIALASANNFNANQGTHVEAWDLTVRSSDPTSTTDIPGRVFTYVMSAYTGGNDRPLTFPIYATTLDGFVYKADLNGLDPNAFLIYGNEQGFLDPQGNPLYHDVLGHQDAVSTVDGGVAFAPPQYPISLTPLSDDTLGALSVTTDPQPAKLTNLQFDGAPSGKRVYENRGGTFSFTTNQHGTYQIAILRNGSTDPTAATNRVLRGVVDAGSQSVVWDGKDNTGNAFPAGENYQVQASMHSGVYHFPLVDAESSVRGGPSFTLQNPPAGDCGFASGCSTAFYDDRGYHTSAGTVGVVGTVLCGANPPATPFSDPINGYVSTTAQRAFGNTATTGNGADCTTTATPVGQFGDRKALDTWTYYPSPEQSASFSIDPTPTAPTAGADNGTTPADTELVVASGAANGLLKNDSGSNVSVTGHSTPAHGSVTTTPQGGWDYTPDHDFSGTDTFTYTITDDDGQTATATVTVKVTPTAGDDQLTTTVNTARSVNVLANDHGSSLAVTAGPNPPAHGTVVVNPDNTITYTPVAGYSGPDSFGYTVADNDTPAQTTTATVHVDVKPQATDDTASTTSGTSTPIDVLGNDVGSPTLTVTGATQPSGGSVSVDPDGSGVVYTSRNTFSGTDTFTYQVTDGNGEKNTATVTVTVKPVAVQDDADTAVDQPVTMSPTANDKGSNTSLGAVGSPTHGTVTVNGNDVTYTPATDFVGTDSFTYTLNGDGGSDTSGVVDVTVKPSSPDDAYSTTVNQSLSEDATHGVLSNDTPAGLTISSHTNPSHGTLTLDNSSGAFSYVPDAEFSGRDTFTYTASGNGATGDPATVTITVVPTAVSQNYGATAGQGLTVATADGVLEGSHGSNLQVTPGTITTTAGGTVAMNTDGSFGYTPKAGYSGPDSFSYTITDASGQTITQTSAVVVAPDAENDSAVGRNGSTTSVPVRDNDTGTNLVVTAKTNGANGANGTVAISPDGKTVSYTPIGDFSGTDTFTYTVTDSTNQTATATVTMTVRPHAVDDRGYTMTAASGASIGVPVLDNDRGTNLSVTGVTQPSHGSSTVNPDGTVTYTPTAAYSGPDTFTYTLTGDGGTDVATVAVTVRPQAMGDVGTVAANGTLTVPAAGVLGNDLGSNLTASTLTGPGHGQLTLNPDGSYVYTPDTGYSGPDSFVYTASDGANQSNATVNLTVTAVAPADGPYPTDAGATLTVSAANGVLANDSGNPTITGHTDPGHGALNLNADGSFTYTPTDPSYSGTDTFTYTARDSSGQNTGPTTVTILVRPVGVSDSYQGVGDTQLVVTQAQGVLANDHATGPRATVGTIQTAQQGTVTMAADGSFTYQPPTRFSGTDSFTYTARDASGQAYTQTATILVVPHAVADSASVAAGTTTATVVPVLANDSGSNLTVTVPQGTSAQGGTVTTDGTTVSYTPATGFSGTDTFGYTITDSATGRTDSATVTVTVSPVAVDDAVTTPIGTPVTVDELANDTVHQPTVTIDRQPAHGRASVDPTTHQISYAPNAGFSGQDTIAYTATDPSMLHASATVTITVTPAAGAITVSTRANSPVAVDVVGQSQGTNLTVTQATNGTNGTVTVNPDGQGVTYTPNNGFSGDDQFGYTLSDGTSSSTGTVRVVVLPTGADDTGTTPVNTRLSVPAPGPLANDVGTNLQASLATQAQHGTVTLAADGSYDYVPTTDFSGTDTFTYRATDASNRSVTQTVTLTVTPTVAADTATTPSGTALTTTRATGVLANDHGSLTASVPSGTTTQGGTVVMASDGSYTYTPRAGFSGKGANADTFTYTATDGTTTRTATVTITVTPVANDDTGSTPYNTPLRVTAPGVLANDSGSALTVVGSTAPSNGTLTRGTDGSYTYTPFAAYSGPDQFSYTVQDSSGQQSTAQVRLSVGLSAAPDAYTTPVDTTLSKDAASGLLANDSGTTLRLTGTTTPAHGTVSALADGSFTYTPDGNWSGNDSFTYTARDASGGTATATVTVKVTPRAVADTGTTTVGTPLQVTAAAGVLGNDRGQGLTVRSSTAPQHGTVTVAADGSYTYTPQAGYSGPDSFDYTATDQAGSPTTATVRISVTPTATDNAATTPVDTPVTLDPAADDHGTSLTLTSVTRPAHGTASVVDGAVRFVPDSGWSGVTTCTYTVTDASGQTATAQLTIRVTPVAVPERVRTGVGTPVTLDSVLNDRGSSLQITSVTQPPATQGRVTIRDGRLDFRPAAGFVGTVTFDYTVTDAAGQTTTATDTVVVSPVGDADPDTATTAENHPVTVDPTANDPGHGSYVLSTLQLRDPRTGVLTDTVSIPGQGTYHVDAATGKVIFTPVKGFHGEADPVTYQVADSAGVLHVSTIRVTVTKAGTSTTATTPTTPTKAGHGGLPGTGGPFGPALPLAGLSLLVGGLVLLVRRRRDRDGERDMERGSHRAR